MISFPAKIRLILTDKKAKNGWRYRISPFLFFMGFASHHIHHLSRAVCVHWWLDHADFARPKAFCWGVSARPPMTRGEACIWCPQTSYRHMSPPTRPLMLAIPWAKVTITIVFISWNPHLSFERQRKAVPSVVGSYTHRDGYKAIEAVQLPSLLRFFRNLFAFFTLNDGFGFLDGFGGHETANPAGAVDVLSRTACGAMTVRFTFWLFHFFYLSFWPLQALLYGTCRYRRSKS